MGHRQRTFGELQDKNVWNAVNDTARMIHDVDGGHPALTVIGGGSIHVGDIPIMCERAPDLDLLGITTTKVLRTYRDSSARAGGTNLTS